MRYEFPKGEENPAKRPEVRKKISESKKGKKNPNWKPKIKLICETCRESFEVCQCRKDTKYCSRKCLGIATSKRMEINNPMKNENVVKKQIKSLKKKYKSGEYIPYMCTEEGKKIISEIAKERAINDNAMNRYIGMTWEEISGEEAGKKRRKIASKRVSGKNNPMFGKPPRFPKPKYIDKLNHIIRSSWEELFCLWLNENNISYEYESGPFKLYINNKVINYWPDIKFNDNTYCEIKCSWLFEGSIKKMTQFVDKYNKKLIIITDYKPMNNKNMIFLPYDKKFWNKKEMLDLI